MLHAGHDSWRAGGAEDVKVRTAAAAAGDGGGADIVPGLVTGVDSVEAEDPAEVAPSPLIEGIINRGMRLIK